MAFKPVVGKDPAQVLVAFEDHAVKIEHLAFEPAGVGPQRGYGRHRGILGGMDLDQQAVVLRHAEQHVDHVEAFGPLGIVDPGDFHQLLVLVLVTQDAQCVLDLAARDRQHDLAVLLDSRDEPGAERLAQRFDHAFVRGEARCGVEYGHSRISNEFMIRSALALVVLQSVAVAK